MNDKELREFNSTYFKYYVRKPVEKDDIIQLDRLVRAGHVKYSLIGGRAHAEATKESKMLHGRKPLFGIKA
ncbi:MAG: hypothetical protein FWD92_01680 [Methanomassiliicoccaceae archaeon]|nr:hypothetical protein [Methanomassiliicoccaceae archaeon]